MKKDTLLVLGGAGFIGSNFIRQFLKRHLNFKIVNFDKLTYAGNFANLADVASNPRYVFVKGDIADKEAIIQVFKKYSPSYIINFAAETHVDRSIHGGAEDFVRTNIFGVFTLLEAVKEFGVRKFVQVSTDEVYGDLPLSSKEKFRENSLLKPSSPYASSKASGDLLCLSYQRTYNLPIVVTRCGNNYGPYQYPEKLVPFFISRILKGQKVPVYGKGQNVRDWVYVLDHCSALEEVLLKKTKSSVYCIGSGNEKNNLEIAEIILSHFGKNKSEIEFVKDRPGHDLRYAIDNYLIKKELGWRPRREFVESFMNTVQWYVKNQEWVKAIENKSEINKHII